MVLHIHCSIWADVHLAKYMILDAHSEVVLQVCHIFRGIHQFFPELSGVRPDQFERVFLGHLLPEQLIFQQLMAVRP